VTSQNTQQRDLIEAYLRAASERDGRYEFSSNGGALCVDRRFVSVLNPLEETPFRYRRGSKFASTYAAGSSGTLYGFINQPGQTD
jgi:hypothetical protein